MNKKYLTKTIVYFVLALVVIPMVWFFSATIIGLFITQPTPEEITANPQAWLNRVKRIAEISRYLHIGIAILGLVFLGLAVYYLIKLLGDEEDKKDKD